jgi:hypothetical protein
LNRFAYFVQQGKNVSGNVGSNGSGNVSDKRTGPSNIVTVNTDGNSGNRSGNNNNTANTSNSNLNGNVNAPAMNVAQSATQSSIPRAIPLVSTSSSGISGNCAVDPVPPSLTVGVVFTSHQVPGCHNVVSGVFDYLQSLQPPGRLVGEISFYGCQ